MLLILLQFRVFQSLVWTYENYVAWPVNWTVGKLLPPDPLMLPPLMPNEINASLRFEARNQHDAMPFMYQPQAPLEFARSYITDYKAMVAVRGRLWQYERRLS